MKRFLYVVLMEALCVVLSDEVALSEKSQITEIA
jgi:hypothetical protein